MAEPWPIPTLAARNAAGGAAPRARRPHGALRRLRHAGAVPGRHHGRAPALPRRAPRCSTSPTWARPSCVGEGAAAALERLAPGRRQGLKPGRQRYGLLTDDGRRHPRRLHGRQPRRPAVPGGQRQPQGTSTSPLIEAALPAGVHAAAAAGPRAAGAAGARRGAGHRAAGAGARRAALHGHRRRSTIAGMPVPGQPLRLHRRGRLRDLASPPTGAEALAQRAAGAARRAAGRPRRARFAAAGGRALPLRQRHRRDHQPGRGGAGLDRSASAAARPGTSPAPSAVRDELANGADAPARRPAARGPPARPRRTRRSRPPTARAVGEVTSGGFGPSVGGPVAMGYVAPRPRRRRHRARTAGARQAAAGPRRRHCPSSPTATPADQEPDPWPRLRLHQGP